VSTAVSVSTTTITAAEPGQSVDQHGCPGVDGSNFEGYDIYCDTTAAFGSFAAGTNPGYNIEDCSSQCFDGPDNIDCLGTTYTPASSPFGSIDGHLQPDTCTFYEYVSGSAI
jgi:hypothetical protein